MVKRLGLLGAILIVAAAVSAPVIGAQVSGRTVPVTGVVVDGSGAPVAGAHVALLRRTQSRQSQGIGLLAQATTDQTGAFSFGAINLQTEIRFPLETGAWLEYTVNADRAPRSIASIEFTAPRSGPEYAVASVYAKLTVR